MLAEFIERRPSFGIVASAAGFGASLLSWINTATTILGFLAAIFGFVAGVYTWRIKKAHWDKIKSHINHH